ncbi:hypothetical protein [Nitrospira sp. Nam74]
MLFNVQAAPAAGQQTISVSEVLAKQASSFPQTSHDASQAASQAALPPTVQQAQQTLTDAAIVALQTQQPLSQVPAQQAVVSPPVTLPSGNNGGPATSSTVQPPLVQQGQQALTVAEILALQTQQPITQVPTQQSVASPDIHQGQPRLTDAEILALQTQQPITQVPTQPIPVNPVLPLPSANGGTSTSPSIQAPTNGAINPLPPQVSVDTSMPTTSVTVKVGPHGDYTDLQTALDNVSLGTTILLEPGVSYTTTHELGFVLPNKTGTGWIVIRPDMPDSALPAPGARVTSADSAWMPKIVRGDENSYAMSVEPGAHNYRIIGVEFLNQGNADTRLNGAFINLDGMESSLSDQSNHIVLDRLYVHGPSAPGSDGVKFGVILGGQYQAVIGSTIEGLVSDDGEAKAIAGWDGAGPWLISNNLLSASGENIMIGGATPIISGLTPSDIEISHNHFYKPLEWRDDSAYTSGPNRVLTKNLLELKNAQRVVIDSNTFENVWPDGQSGHAVVLTPRGGGSTGSDSWTTVSDIAITNNQFLNVANGFAISGGGPTISLDQGGPTQRGGRILIENNVFTGLGGDYDSVNLSGNFATIGMGPSDLQIKHNTVASYAGTNIRGTTLAFTYGISDEGALFPLIHFALQDNHFAAREYPMTLSGAPDLNTLMPGYIWTNNVFAGPWPTGGGWTIDMMPQGNGNEYPA